MSNILSVRRRCEDNIQSDGSWRVQERNQTSVASKQHNFGVHKEKEVSMLREKQNS